MLKITYYPEKSTWQTILKRPTIDTAVLEADVKAILLNVKQNGDTALCEYTLAFDGVALQSFEVTAEEVSKAVGLVSDELKAAINTAKDNILKFHAAQKEESKIIETTNGVQCWRKSVGIQKVGLYIPGGTAPLFSTVLMLGIPAMLAGCKDVILCTPCNKEGVINPAILYTAQLVGITKIFKIGGAQAIAAMAYGTASVPQVYKIFGPGNQYVTCAKQFVTNEGIAIDMPAGPSEVAVIADNTCVPAYVAADLLSQAEHGKDSQVLLVSNDEAVLQNIITELEIQLATLPRNTIATQALENSKVVLVNDLTEGIDLLNEYAPEHLIIACQDTENIMDMVVNAGSVFLGNYTCESAGDYASGTNHTLPTNGYAKAYSGVSLDSFVKKITFQKITKVGINNLGTTIKIMAEAEGLYAHKNAVSIRLKN